MLYLWEQNIRGPQDVALPVLFLQHNGAEAFTITKVTISHIEIQRSAS